MEREIIKMRVFFFLGKIFTIMTIIGSIYIFMNWGKSPVWDSIIPMILAVTFNVLYIKSVKKIKKIEEDEE